MMPLSDYLVEQLTIERFKESDLNKLPFAVESNVRWREGVEAFEFEILIKYNSIPLAVVEVKKSLTPVHIMNHAKQKIDRAFRILNCNYGIVTDNTNFYLCNKTNKEYIKYDFENIIAFLKDHINTFREKSNQATIKDIDIILNENKFGAFVGKLEENDGKYYYKDNKETLFWMKLLKSKKKFPQKIYRYTSLDTIFSLLKNGTYRMNGIVGMNDSSEIDYFDDYCYPKRNKLSYQILNNLFLSSCSLLYDDLTMWRLYGDDAKGVCLEFELRPDMRKEFMLQIVSYANGKKKNDKLDLIKELIKKKVVFNDIDKWKHFFKAKDYSIEKEIRLLFADDSKTTIVKNRDWIKTSDHSIINPYVEFDINNAGFPLELKKIILGSKCPEASTNINQLNELIRQKGYTIEVKLSSIKNYR